MSVDERIARSQLDTLQRLLYKIANRYPLTGVCEPIDGFL
jgi:hypothetical protein